MSSFTIYDPLEELAAQVAELENGGGSGGGLPSSGGTLSGDLTLTPPAKVIQSQAPVNPDDLTNKAYVDNAIANAPYLPLAGGTMSGQILQPLAPTTANDLVNKAYVDSAVGSGSGGPYLPLTGGTMSGAIVQPIAPVSANDVVNKAYVDTKLATPGSIPGSSIIPAGNTQFGTIEFDPSGDLTQTATNSGIALLKQPATGTVAVDVGFDSTGKFVSTKLGTVLSSGLLVDGAAFTAGNLMLTVSNLPPRSLQIHFVSGPGGYIAGSAQPYWDSGTPPTANDIGRYIYRNVGTTGYVYLSQRVTGEPTGSTLTEEPFDTSGNTDPSELGAGFVEIYNIYVNDNVDNGVFRITVNQVNVPTGTSNSYIAVERLSA